jgi:hypothetical protein
LLKRKFNSLGRLNIPFSWKMEYIRNGRFRWSLAPIRNPTLSLSGKVKGNEIKCSLSLLSKLNPE